jgi:DNA-binding response OmpR family regulator
MGKVRLLVVEDDVDIANMLKIYFTGLNYEVDVAARGMDALEKTKKVLPHLIVLDILLPDINGYEVCRSLRTSTRTSHIPVIFLTQKDERSDRLQGLELGADDYITKPFDIEELKLRVMGAVRRSERESLTDPRTGLPAGRLIEEQLRRIIREGGWALLDIRLNNFDAFRDVYGFVASDDVLRFTAMLLGEQVDELGTPGDFIGHVVIITTNEAAEILKRSLKERFADEVKTHYNFIDRQQGFIQAPRSDGALVKVSFMTLSIGLVSPSPQSFADIREITELAAEARRRDGVTSTIG